MPPIRLYTSTILHSHDGKGNFNILVEISLLLIINSTKLIINSDNSSSNPPSGVAIRRIFVVSLLLISFSPEIFQLKKNFGYMVSL